MKQAKIQERLIHSTSQTIEKTSKRISDITVVVADEQTKVWQIIDKGNRDDIQQNYYLKCFIDDEIKSVQECHNKMDNIISEMNRFHSLTNFSSMTYTLNDLFDFIKQNSKK